MSEQATVQRLLETADRLTRRLNALETGQREAPPFDRTPRPRPASPEAAFQAREAAAGRLTQVIEPDDTGRRIKRFYGDPELCWGQFKQPIRHVTGWRTKL